MLDNVGGAGVLTITNCTFTRCSYHLAPGSNIRSQTGAWTFGSNIFTSSKLTNAGGVSGTCAEFGFRSDDSSTLAMTFNSFDGLVGFVTIRNGITITDNVFLGMNYAAGGGQYTSDAYFARNFFYYNDGDSGSSLMGPIKDCYIYDYAATNPHVTNPTATNGLAAMSVTGCIVEGVSGLGECFFVQKTTTGTPTFTAKYNIVIPSVGLDHGACAMIAALPVVSGCLTQCTIEHNTQCSCNESSFIDLGETQGSYAGALQSVRSNIVWTTNPSGGFCNAIIDRSPTPTTDALATTPGAGYNGFFNPSSTNCTMNNVTVSCIGYNTLKCSTAGFPSTQLGTGDKSGDPAFVDPTRGLATWGGTAAGGSVATVAGAVATLAANPALIMQATTGLIPWVRAGYVPTNPVFQACSYPGDASTTDAAGNAWSGGSPGLGAMTVPVSAAAAGIRGVASITDASKYAAIDAPKGLPQKAVAAGWV